MNSQYRFEDIEHFLMDDDFFQWVKYGTSDSGFDYNLYLSQYPGEEEKIEFARVFIGRVRLEEKGTYSHTRKIKNAAKIIQGQRRKKFFTRRISFVASAVAVVAIVVGSYFMLNNSQPMTPSEEYASLFQTAVKTDGIIKIILNNGQVINMDDNNPEIILSKNGAISAGNVQLSGLEASDDKDAVTRIIVPHGKRSRLVLPDGTIAWLNSGTQAVYKTDFLENRRLYINGEVYLDVTHDETRPFSVITNRLKVNVLGTAFNVCDYNSDSLALVVLVRGSVDVENRNVKTGLLPNQSFSVENGTSKVRNIDVYPYTCWKEGVVNFEGKQLSYILQELSRYYSVEIVGLDRVTKEKCYGSLDLNKSIDDVLEYISQSIPFTYSRMGNKIVVSSPSKK